MWIKDPATGDLLNRDNLLYIQASDQEGVPCPVFGLAIGKLSCLEFACRLPAGMTPKEALRRFATLLVPCDPLGGPACDGN